MDVDDVAVFGLALQIHTVMDDVNTSPALIEHHTCLRRAEFLVPVRPRPGFSGKAEDEPPT
jgi:hypothetical protein